MQKKYKEYVGRGS